jgi:hypothetical protein
MANYPTSPLPEYPLEEVRNEPEVLITKHKDGSEQRRLKSTTGTLRSFKLMYGNSCPLTFTEVSLITSHYDGEYGNLNSFNFVHPERTGETYVCRYNARPKSSLVGINSYTLQVELQVVPA